MSRDRVVESIVSPRREANRSYLIAEDVLAPNDRGSAILLSLAIVWSNDAAGALGVLIGAGKTILHGMRYLHGRHSAAAVEATVDGRRRSFHVIAASDIPVPLFVEIATSESPALTTCILAASGTRS